MISTNESRRREQQSVYDQSIAAAALLSRRQAQRFSTPVLVTAWSGIFARGVVESVLAERGNERSAPRLRRKRRKW